MALSHAFLQALVDATYPSVINNHLGKPLHLLTGHYAFPLSKDRRNRFVIALDHSEPYLAITDMNLTSSGVSSNFFQVLRKELTNAYVTDYFLWPNDRIVELQVSNITPAYVEVKRRLIIELIPMQPNLLILDEANKILGVWKPSRSFNVARPLMVNLTYAAPSYASVSSPFSKEEQVELNERKEIPPTFNKLYVTNNKLYSIVPLTNSGVSHQISVNDFFYNHYEALNAKRKNDLYEDVYKVIKRKNKQLSVKIKRQQADLNKAEAQLEYFELGNLLLTYQDQIPKRAHSVILEGRSISLDPTLDVFGNANKYFKQYHKAKTAVNKIAEQKALSENELAYFNNLNVQLLHANETDLKEIKTELNSGSYLNAYGPIKKQIKQKTVYPYVISYDGYQIGFGKNNLQNNYLTFTLAKPYDYFFHAKNYSGAHVVIFSKDPSKLAIEMAASIALYLSGLTSGEVYLADKRDVKTAPERGRVHLLKYETLYLSALASEVELVINEAKRIH